MATIRIAEVARRTGLPAPALRYYEQVSLLPAPERTSAGYRVYDEPVLDRLAFIARAKALGCSLDEIAGLMPEWDGGRCAPVQRRLRELAAARPSDVQKRVEALRAFSADLQGILATLGPTALEGPCHSGCGCLSDARSGPPLPTPVALGLSPAKPKAPAIACTLEADERPGRLREWRDVLVHVAGREAIDGGARLELDSTTPLGQLALLVEAEQGCCGFFSFAITVDGRGLGLEVRAPSGAQAIVASLFGVAA